MHADLHPGNRMMVKYLYHYRLWGLNIRQAGLYLW